MKKLFILLLSAALLLTGCGSKSASTGSYAISETAANDMLFEGSSFETDFGDSQTLPQGQKFIITMDIQAEAEDLDAALSAVTEKAGALGGYIEDQSQYNGSLYSGRRYRSASLTVRIPAEKLEEFTAAVENAGNVVSSSRSTQDVTLEYVDTESRITALKTEQARLLELMDEAATMSDLLEIESRLTDVRGELEQYTSRLKVLENQVDYATVNLDLTEVTEYTPVAEKTRLQKIKDGFVDSIGGVWNGILDFVSLVIIDLPYLVVFGLVLWAVIALIRRRIRKRKKAKADNPNA
ncbi:MAG: DUF4349 domain-containing protein [Candidatus Faecousia sp.]|nr:DUF4349 domain-containing protein [Candidatus Faecousia sp.]